MSSRSAQAKSQGQRRVRERILHLLKLAGPQEAAALAAQLALTPMAVRQHLQILRGQGQVSYTEQRRPLGRPVKLWQLTATAAAHFPDNHAELTVGLLEALHSVLGELGLEQILCERSQQQIRLYQRQVPVSPLAEKVQALADLRSREGYMAEALAQGDGSWLLIENHCPIGTAARTCPGLCAGELTVFQTVLGAGVRVERTEHLLAGSRRCVYRIQAQAASLPIAT